MRKTSGLHLWPGPFSQVIEQYHRVRATNKGLETLHAFFMLEQRHWRTGIRVPIRVTHSVVTFHSAVADDVMDVNGARMWLIKSSLLATACVFVFLLVAPLLSYPLDWERT
jgi:hypothetical protein